MANKKPTKIATTTLDNLMDNYRAEKDLIETKLNGLEGRFQKLRDERDELENNIKEIDVILCELSNVKDKINEYCPVV